MLHEEITAYVRQRHEALVTRFFPAWQLPGFFAGYRAARHDAADFAYNLAHLHKLGVTEIAGTPVIDAISAMLKEVDGPTTRTFWSYRVAEALAAFGPWDDNPILAQLTPAERDNVLQAIDSTAVYNPATDKLGGLPNNYWGVLARCEYARQRLGVLKDNTLLEKSLGRVQKFLFANESCYFDDHPDGHGRYDIYSIDTHLFLEPLWERFDPVKLRRSLIAQIRLVEKAAMENGACVVWGRSTGAMSVCLTMETCAAALKLGLAADADRSQALVRHAFEQFQGWIADDLISAHRYRHTYKYRGPQRLLGMTLDCLGKLLYTAEALSSSPSPGTPGEGRGGGSHLFPPIDELIPFDQTTAVWLFRNDRIAFQLPVVAYHTADYVPWPRSPQLFDNPVDSDMIVGVPRVAVGSDVYTVAGRASSIQKTPAGLSVTYDTLRLTTPREGAASTLPCRVSANYRVERETIHATFSLTFDTIPDAVALDIAEGQRPLYVHVDGGHTSIAQVEGIPPFRSFWGELRRWHQTDLPPAKSMTVSYSIRPALRVTEVPIDSDYNRALYDSLPPGELVERGYGNGSCFRQMDVAGFAADSDIVHIGWPEHLFASHGLPLEEFDKRLYAFFEKLAASGKKIVWTMHNRIPHAWEHERGKALYRALAPHVDGLIHHSHCGMKKMIAELPYKASAKHVVIPHGHFGAMMPKLDRAALEKKYGLSPVPIRFGMLGRPQKEKQFGMVLNAFIAAGREDQEMLITVNQGDPPPVEHPRVKTVTRVGFLTRDIVSEHNQLCDVLVSAHSGETYLTSGIPADAIGLGQAMFVPDWDYFHEHLGDAAVYHDNTEATLTQLFREFTVEQMHAKQAAMAALQDRYDQRRLAGQMLAFFRSL